MRKLNLKILALAVSLLILILLIIYADPAKFLAIVAASNYKFLALAFGISTISVLLRVMKWKVLLDGVSFSSIMPVQMLGMTISNFSPGKIAEPIKGVIFKLKEGRAVSSILPSIIWERVIDVVVLVILAMVGAYFFLILDPKFYLISIFVISVFILALVVGLLTMYKKGFGLWIFKILKRLPFTGRLSDSFIKTFQESRVNRSKVAYSFVITIIAWVLEGFVLHYAFLSIGINLSPIILASIFALATLIGIASSLPGGIGSTEVVMTIFLGYFGIEKSLAIVGILLARFLSIWYVNLLGGLSLIYLMKKLNISYKSILG